MRLTILATVVIIAAVTLMLALRGHLPAPRASGEAAIGGAFALTDQHGKTVKDADFHGRFMLVYFGFTHCPDICPTALAAMTRALDALGDDAKRVVPIFITVDPERDNVAAMKKYAASFPRLVALTGDKKHIEAVEAAYKVYAAKVNTKGKDYAVDHSGFIYLMDGEGKYLRHFPSDVADNDLSGALRKALARTTPPLR